MSGGEAPALVPWLGALYAALAPWAEVLLRAATGLLLVPHGLRAYCGMFKGTGPPVENFRQMAAFLHGAGYKPGAFWALVIAIIEFALGPMLALGLFTRPAALVIFVFLFASCVVHWRMGRWFWNREGIEYPLLWTVAAFYFLIRGGGPYSLDAVIGWSF